MKYSTIKIEIIIFKKIRKEKQIIFLVFKTSKTSTLKQKNYTKKISNNITFSLYD